MGGYRVKHMQEDEYDVDVNLMNGYIYGEHRGVDSHRKVYSCAGRHELIERDIDCDINWESIEDLIELEDEDEDED